MGAGASKGYVALRETTTVTVSIQTDPWSPPPAVATQIQATSVSVAKSKPNVPNESNGIEDSWLAVCESLDVAEGQANPHKDLVVKRTGWKTIRIFVSSTCRDFQIERELLVKEVFPDLRAWCEERRLHLVECDLRWGVPKDSTTELTLRTCLGEIDRCYQDNIMPYFLNMTSERIGWIPEPSEVPQNLVDEYRWVFGLSITEMEIIHGAYRKDNPNSLFLIRDDSFIDQVPASHKNIFIDENTIAPAKLDLLKQKIKERFPPYRVIQYKCKYEEIISEKQVKLTVDPIFSEKVMSFFKERISIQYPMSEDEGDPLEKTREAHETFLRSRSENVLGRATIIAQVAAHIDSGGTDTPLLIVGGPGSGKSSILSKVADDVITRAQNGQVPGGGDQPWHVFYHFVGAVPGSTDLQEMLIRLLTEISAIDDTNAPSDLDSTVQLACSILNYPSTRPLIVIIDALNQFDEEHAAMAMTWVPRKLSPRVRCVFSMIQDTPQHKNLLARESKATEVIVKPLSLSIRKDMVTEYLGKYNKRLDMDQMIQLLSKKSSENPLWLSIACEELRIQGQFRTLNSQIENMADGLLELLQQVLQRFEMEGGGRLLVATLCMLEVSGTGLLESELLTMLADEDDLSPPKPGEEKGGKEKSEKSEKARSYQKQLPAVKWAAVYRSLRPFLRPFGNIGEGRLDFYHRSLSKTVRKVYLHSAGDADGKLSPIYRFWHTKLADFFLASDNYDRKVEEGPYHLIKLKRISVLENMLQDWEVFYRLYDRDFSGKLMRYWIAVGGKDRLLECYSEKLQELQDLKDLEMLSTKYEDVSRFIVQMGEYNYSMDLAMKVLDLEMNSLGERKERMADLYSLVAYIWDQRTKMVEFCGKEQIPDQLKCVKYNKQAVELLIGLPDRSHKVKLGNQYIKLAFALAGLQDCGGSDELEGEGDALTQGNEYITKAIAIFTEQRDAGNLAEAYMTEAVLCRYNRQKQIKLYEKALELCLQAYGRYHRLTGRIYFNTAICYEDDRQYDKAYDLFKENLLVNREVFGKQHVKYQRAHALFSEPVYRTRKTQRRDQDIDA